MRPLPAFAFLALATVILAAQQPAPLTPPPGGTTPPQANGAAPSPDSSPVPYKVGGRISPPAVLHSVNPEFSDEARRANYQGACLITLTVDAQGNPQNIRVVRALGMGLDEKAIEAIRQYKFKPAMKDGKTPVAVMVTIEVVFRLYARGKPVPSTAPGFDTVPSNVSPPHLLDYVVPKYSYNGRKNRISGDCVIGLTVDTHGVPQNVHVVTSLEPSLDENAVKAVKQWRYTPAMSNGNAVPFESTVKVNFTLPG
ncbi:MAG: energy transducer TonB [Terracidiphilus sp.]